MTFPYILAKVRLQAKYDPETNETELTTGASAQTVRKKERYSSAWDVLAKVYEEKGLAGWYQVRLSARLLRSQLTFAYAGHASAYFQGCPCTGTAFRHQRCA